MDCIRKWLDRLRALISPDSNDYILWRLMREMQHILEVYADTREDLERR